MILIHHRQDNKARQDAVPMHNRIGMEARNAGAQPLPQRSLRRKRRSNQRDNTRIRPKRWITDGVRQDPRNGDGERSSASASRRRERVDGRVEQRKDGTCAVLNAGGQEEGRYGAAKDVRDDELVLSK